ncbi:MAG: helix-turn-helix domain-containing protein [Deltaproteobacteria bacterium]|nr:helix-turn-helix domain-containing protein [Deltaproteobacteria bacterium]
MLRVYKFRLYPTRAQEHALGVLLGRLRFLYNAALQERRDGYHHGVKVTHATQEKALTAIKNDPECPDYAGIHTHLLQDVVKRLDRAFEGSSAG